MIPRIVRPGPVPPSRRRPAAREALPHREVSRGRAVWALALLFLLGVPTSGTAQQEGWDVVLGARAGVYAPSAAILHRNYVVRFAEAEVGYSPQASVELGLATGSPATVLRLLVGHAPSLDLTVWRRGCGRGPVCSLGTAPGGVTTVVAEVAAPFGSPLEEWDMAFVGGVGAKRYGWGEPECGGPGIQPEECDDARALSHARSVFTVHLGVEALYPIGRHALVVEVGDYLSGFGVRTEGAAQGQFQNDLVLALGARLRRPM